MEKRSRMVAARFAGRLPYGTCGSVGAGGEKLPPATRSNVPKTHHLDQVFKFVSQPLEHARPRLVNRPNIHPQVFRDIVW